MGKTLVIFDIDGIRDPDTSEYVSLNIALLRGLVDPNTGEVKTTLKANAKKLITNSGYLKYIEHR